MWAAVRRRSPLPRCTREEQPPTHTTAHRPRPPGFPYTLGSPLRIPNIKNVGKDLAPEELRICPEFAGGPARPAKNCDFTCQNAKILEKIARCARHGDDRRPRNQDFAMEAENSRPSCQNDALNTDFLSRVMELPHLFPPLGPNRFFGSKRPILAQ